jgi:hypothetical protein
MREPVGEHQVCRTLEVDTPSSHHDPSRWMRETIIR